MKIEYDTRRDLLYVWFGAVATKAARTVTVSPGVHADFDAHGKLIGFEVLDATEVLGKKVQFEVLGKKVQFEVALPSGAEAQAAKS